ncbi:hypothetical protein JW865_02710 [Candidatus Bathyarchaeota archaeon]|nr:hypothetical protein [Candidatus Bathyarchaeota archaeon]
MKQNQKFGLIGLALIALIAASGLLAINALSVQSSNNSLSVKSLEKIEKPILAEATDIVKEETVDIDKLKDRIPSTFEEAEALILPVRSRFLLYTKDLKHIMWGSFGNNHFVGVDNLGKRAWGIYYRGVFAGFYDGEFFWGKYSNGYWKAQNLFGLPQSYGQYTTAPMMTAITAAP